MKKKLLALLLMVLIPLSAAYAATTHYGYVTPTVGGSQNTWGTLLNTIFGTIDTNIWNASGGLTTAVNVASSSANITLTNPVSSVQNITMTTTGKKLILPAMNATTSIVPGGQVFTVNNVGSNAFDVDAQDGATAILAGLSGGKSVQIQLLTNSTANGTFQTYGPYLTSISGNISLGTSASSPSPANTTAANTGLYSTTTSNVGVSVLGTSVGLWNASGYNGAIGATTSAVANVTTLTAATVTGAATNATAFTGGSFTGTTGTFSGLVTANTSGVKYPDGATQTAAVTPIVAKTTWTPTVQFGGSSTGITYTTHTGNYTQFGKVIVLDYNITLSSVGSSTGTATINGLPVAVGSTDTATCGLAAFSNMNSITGPIFMQSSASLLNVIEAGSTGGTALTNTNFTSTSVLQGGCVYITN